eukprot:11487604-Alexandrium_andersonii.AAC.1
MRKRAARDAGVITLDEAVSMNKAKVNAIRSPKVDRNRTPLRRPLLAPTELKACRQCKTYAVDADFSLGAT